VAGTAEPIYGPSAIRPVGDEVDKSTYTELTRDDLKWQVLETTNVETETFYFVAESGQIAMAQVIYSNVM
jgi:Svf1-like N-terminal lipocalin domain